MDTLQKLRKGSYHVEGAMCDVQCALAAGKNVQCAGVKQVKNTSRPKPWKWPTAVP